MRWVAIAAAAIVVLFLGVAAWSTWVANPRVVRELRESPQGERARRVMILTLPSGKRLPVNYLREGETVYCAADFPWWRELREGPGRGSVFIQGEELPGTVRVVTDDPELRSSVFARLRPNALSFAGTLVVVDLAPEAAREEKP